MRQSQCDRHKVKMMDVFGPLRSLISTGCRDAASRNRSFAPNATFRPVGRLLGYIWSPCIRVEVSLGSNFFPDLLSSAF